MSLTLITDFLDFSPVYNKEEFAISSTEIAQPGFKYVASVTVEGETVKVFKILPEPITGSNLGTEDIHNFLETFVVPQFGTFNSVTGFEYSVDTIRKFSVLYQEEWLVSGLPVIGQESIQGGDKYIWEGSFPHHDWIDQYNETNPFITWLCNGTNGTAAEFLTNQKSKRVKITDLGWTWFMTDTPNDCRVLAIETYDSAGASIASFEITSGLVTTNTTARLQRVTSAPQSLNNVDGAQVTTGAQPIITSSVASYTIQLKDATGTTAASELLTFNIETACRYTPIRLHFENELGGYDAFNFNFRNQDSSSFERTTYMSDPTTITASGLSYSHTQVQTVTNYVKENKTIKCRSEYLSTEELLWLKELKKSTSIFLEFVDLSGVHNFKPIASIGGNWIQKETEIDKLFTMDIDIVLGWSDYAQRK